MVLDHTDWLVVGSNLMFAALHGDKRGDNWIIVGLEAIPGLLPPGIQVDDVRFPGATVQAETAISQTLKGSIDL